VPTGGLIAVTADTAVELTETFLSTSCAGGRHNMPPPLQIDLWPFDLENGVRITSQHNVAYLYANFSLPRPLCSRLRPDVRDRQVSDVRRASSLNAPYHRGGAIKIVSQITAKRRQLFDVCVRSHQHNSSQKAELVWVCA